MHISAGTKIYELVASSELPHVRLDLRKMSSEDPLDDVSGTAGQTGAADATIVLKRERAHRDATLFLTGRDIEERKIGIRWEPSTTSWILRGEAEISEERSAIVGALKDAKAPLTPTQLAATLSKPYSTVKQLAWRMANEGQIVPDAKGRYSIPNNSHLGY